MRYMFRRFAACLMSLMLAFSWTAAQAEQEPLLPDLDKLEALLDAFTDVMYGQEFTGFRADASDQAPQVVYGLMWQLLYRGLLPYTPVDGVIIPYPGTAGIALWAAVCAGKFYTSRERLL